MDMHDKNKNKITRLVKQAGNVVVAEDATI